LLRGGAPDHAVATSKTFRSLARICGSEPSSEGMFVRRILSAADLDEWIPKLLEMGKDDIAELPGVSSGRAHQVVAGALVASAVMDVFDLRELEICPWALREGVILDRLDQLSALG
jgi:exopolyphosphatase/guanosine-5'-triphosphate,3'-diphosphate pyrophosphatase